MEQNKNNKKKVIKQEMPTKNKLLETTEKVGKLEKGVVYYSETL